MAVYSIFEATATVAAGIVASSCMGYLPRTNALLTTTSYPVQEVGRPSPQACVGGNVTGDRDGSERGQTRDPHNHLLPGTHPRVGASDPLYDCSCVTSIPQAECEALLALCASPGLPSVLLFGPERHAQLPVPLRTGLGVLNGQRHLCGRAVHRFRYGPPHRPQWESSGPPAHCRL